MMIGFESALGGAQLSKDGKVWILARIHPDPAEQLGHRAIRLGLGPACPVLKAEVRHPREQDGTRGRDLDLGSRGYGLTWRVQDEQGWWLRLGELTWSRRLLPDRRARAHDQADSRGIGILWQGLNCAKDAARAQAPGAGRDADG